MYMYGLIVTNLWIVICVVLFIGYLTYADYYDAINKKSVIFEFCSMSAGAFFMAAMMILLSDYDASENPLNIFFYRFCVVFGVMITIVFIALLFSNIGLVRQYFGRKRNKI